jgi:hypothetical protein
VLVRSAVKIADVFIGTTVVRQSETIACGVVSSSKGVTEGKLGSGGWFVMINDPHYTRAWYLQILAGPAYAPGRSVARQRGTF